MDRPIGRRRILGLLASGLMQAAVAGAHLPAALADGTAASASPKERKMTRDVEALLRDQAGTATVCVAFHDLATGDEVRIRPDQRLHPASTIKLCVLMELFHQAHAGVFSLDDDTLLIQNEFRSAADGSTFTLSAENDGEQTLYKRLGQRETLRELARLMIVRSSNLATNLLVKKLTPERATAFMKELGAPDLIVLRGVEDDKAYALGMNNVASAGGLMRVLTLLGQKKVVSPEASDAMIGILLGQEFNEGIPAGLPAGVKVAHKTGYFSGTYHDAGIVFPPGRPPYVLVVLTQGFADEALAHKTVAGISRLLYLAAPGS